jgi:hypothetical protein
LNFGTQYAFSFSVHDLRSAAVCTATSLLLKPNDETMLRNRNFYQQQGIDDSDFVARKVPVHLGSLSKSSKLEGCM